jgi:lipoprotein signal peptidase
MSKFLKIAFLVCALISIDQYSKNFFFNVPDSYFIHKHFNHYFIFGYFSSASPEIKYLLTGIIFSTVLLIFFTIDFIFFSNHRIIQIGLWTLFSGLTGNMLDKIFLEGVRDFIPILPNIYTNVADITQWIGFFIFTYGIFRYADQIWYISSKRNKLLVYPKEQLLFSSVITLLVLFSCLGIVLSSLSFLKFMNISNDKKELYLVICFSLTFLTILLSFLFCIFLSSKIWGPIFSFKRHLQNQSTYQFQPRKSDFLQNLGENLAGKSSRIK